MKPSPMPIFNYRKRDRQALVSDPQKNDKSSYESGVTPSTASSNQNTWTTNKFANNSNFTGPSGNMNSSSTMSFNKGDQNQLLANKQSAAYPPKQMPLSLSKTPSLINHKPGITNRRPPTSATPQQKFENGLSSFKQNHNPRGSFSDTNNRGRGRGGRISGKDNSGGFQSNTTAAAGDAFNFSSGNNANTPQNSTCQKGWARNNINTKPSTSFSSAGYNNANNVSPRQTGLVMSKNAWSNRASSTSSSNMLNDPRGNKTGNVRTGPDVVKLQSGNVVGRSQFGIARKNDSQPKRFNPSQPPSFSEDDNYTHQFGGNARASHSIFDDEDVATGPSSKFMRNYIPYENDLKSLIISEPTDTAIIGGKEFYIRDQSATIQCVFYEIDRELPDLVKGQVHRLVGSMHKKRDSGSGYFKVLSVRKADKDERSSCQYATEVSLNEMDTLARKLEREQ